MKCKTKQYIGTIESNKRDKIRKLMKRNDQEYSRIIG